MAEEVKAEEVREEEGPAGGAAGEGTEEEGKKEEPQEEPAGALAEALQTVSEKNTRIDELEVEVGALKAAGEVMVKNLDEAKAAAAVAETRGAEFQAIALAKYREALTEGHPDIPSQLIQGNSIEELFHSVDTGKEVVNQIRESIKEEAGAVAVPAGAPERGGISLEGLSSREKIAVGISKGG